MISTRRRRRHLPRLAAAALLAGAAASVRGAGRDTAFYPVSAHPLSESDAPPLVFEKLFETTLEGTPAPDGLTMPARDGDPILVRTSVGTFRIDPRTGARRDPGAAPPAAPGSPPDAEAAPEPAAAGAHAAAEGVFGEPAPPVPPPAGSLACLLPGGAPRWLRRLPLASMGYGCLEGPGGVLAVIGRDGSLFAREIRGGHLFWRRTASHRISRTPVSHGPYLIVAPDASREVQALRWSDGTPAGVFRLDSEDAYVVSAPLELAGRLYLLTVESPRPETRLIALALRPLAPGPPGAAPLPANVTR